MAAKLVLPSLLLLTTALHYGQAIRYVVTSPNTFRFDALETIGVSVSEMTTPTVDVQVYLQDYPQRTKMFSSKTLRIEKGKPQVTTVTVKPSDIPEKIRDEAIVRVYLVVNPTKGEFGKREVVVPITKHSGYAFIQTDKPLYLPNQNVEIRVFSLTEKLLPNREIFALEVKNPNDVQVMFNETKPEASGIATTKFTLSSAPMFGNWKIIVHYGYKQSAKSTINFEVKEYVLPRFSVEIKTPRTILSTNKTIEGTVKARYVYGEPVQGTVILKYEVRTKEGLSLPIGTHKHKELGRRNGEYQFTVDVEKDLKGNNIPWFPAIAGSKFVVEAEVMEQSSGKREKNIDSSSIFTNSPYIIAFPRSRKDFKPGVPYQIQIDVRYPDGTELDGSIQVTVENAFATTKASRQRQLINEPKTHTTDKLGRVMFEFNTADQDIQLQITVKTAAQNVPSTNQAVGKLTVVPFKSPGGSYVWIAAPQKEFLTFQVGVSFKTHVTINPPDTRTNLYYMVVSRGTVVHFNEIPHEGDAFVRSVQFLITAAMSPSARLIVFIIRNGNIIADSMRVVVERKCSYNNLKGLHLSWSGARGVGSIKPGEGTEIEISGEPRSHVGIAGVDEALYLLNKRRVLSPEKMFSEMDSHDLGCGPGGGENTEAVFRQAGVIILSNAVVGDHTRKAGDCEAKVRAKREIQSAEDKLLQYSGENRVCCQLGTMKGPENSTCTERADIILNATSNEECARAFLECCQHKLQHQEKISALIGRMNARQRNELEAIDEEIEQDEEEVLRSIREIFPETLFFKTFSIGGAECSAVSAAGDVCSYKFKVPHSITKWKIQAVGISDTTGLCVAEPIQLTVFKPLFLQMDLPYTAVRGEQIEVPVTVFNYGGNDLNVKVYMLGVEGICMGLTDGERSEIHRVQVPARGAKTVTFTVMPLEVTEYSVRAVAMSNDGSDAIAKPLKVVSEGVKKVITLSRLLDPAGAYKRKREIQENQVTESFDNHKHTITVEMGLPNNHVPGSENCFVSVVGTVMGQAVTTTLSGAVQHFIRLPTGCAEQTMTALAPLVYTMLYLKRSKQMTPSAETNGYNYINNGYIHQLKYRQTDGSFGYSPSNPSNMGLTAFAARVFCQAYDFIRVSKDVSCNAVTWLLRYQKATGAFDATHRFINYMNTPGESERIFTAFVLITLQECQHCNTRDINVAMSKANNFLQTQLQVSQRPFTVAIMTYALTLSKSIKANDAIAKLKDMSLYDQGSNIRWWQTGMSKAGAANLPWVYQTRPSAEDVTTTGYALLTMLLNDDIEYSHAIAKWLNQQRSPQGSFVSTQDTVVALQALAEYSTKAVNTLPDMVCNITSQRSGRGRRSIVVNKHNALLLQEGQIATGGKLVMITEGKGLASMNLAMHYNVDERPEETCKFDLNVTSSEHRDVLRKKSKRVQNVIPAGAVKDVLDPEEYNKLDKVDNSGPKHSIVELTICVRFLENKPAEMSILEVGVLTGYKPVEDDLKMLTDDSQLTKVSNYELTDRSVILYLDEVPNVRPLCFELRTIREIRVGQVQPTAVKIYDYYEPSKACTKFYRPNSNSPMLQKICEGRQCTCVEGQCPVCNPFENFIETRAEARFLDLLGEACDKHHYVWLVQHLRSYNKESLKYFDVKVIKVWKEGLQRAEDLDDEEISFSSLQDCRCPEMRRGEEYVIMGSNTIQTKNKDGETQYKYVFTKDTSVYHSQDIRKFKTPGEQSMQKSFNRLGNRLIGGGCPN